MDTLKGLLANVTRRHVLVFLLVILLFVAFSVSRCVAVHAPDNASSEGDGEGVPGIEEASPAEEDEPVLDDEQKKLYEGYDEQTRNFVNLLAANTWTAQGESRSLTFTDKTFTEAAGQQDGQNEHTFAVSAYERTEDTESGVNGETKQTVTHNAAILTDDGTYLITLRQITSTAGSQSVGWSVTSNAFRYSDSYTLAKASEGLSISGLNSSFSSLIDNRTDELSQAVSDYCSKYYPTATKAEWSKTTALDWESSTVSTSFRLDNASKTDITVVYDMQSGSFAVN